MGFLHCENSFKIIYSSYYAKTETHDKSYSTIWNHNIKKRQTILLSDNTFPFMFIFDDIDDISLIILYFVNISVAYNVTI